MDLADLLQSNIDLHQKNLDEIVEYSINNKNKLYEIGVMSMKEYLLNNSEYKEKLLKKISEHNRIIQNYKNALLETENDKEKILLEFGLKCLTLNYNYTQFKNEHKKVFKQQMSIYTL